MAYAKHARIELVGSWVDEAAEVWASTLHVTQFGSDWLDDPDDYISEITSALHDWWVSEAAGISSLATLETLKVNNINPDGTYAEAITHLHDFAQPLVGFAAPKGPQFCSVVFSYDSGIKRGFAARGRSYLPNCTRALSTAMRFSDADAAFELVAANGFLDVFRNVTSDSNRATPVLVSKHAAEIRSISGVSVDNIFDVQSRRKNRIAGTRFSAAYPTP